MNTLELIFMLRRSRAVRHYVITCEEDIDVSVARELFEQDYPGVHYTGQMEVETQAHEVTSSVNDVVEVVDDDEIMSESDGNSDMMEDEEITSDEGMSEVEDSGDDSVFTISDGEMEESSDTDESGEMSVDEETCEEVYEVSSEEVYEDDSSSEYLPSPSYSPVYGNDNFSE